MALRFQHQYCQSKDIESGRKDAEKIGYPFVIKAQVPVGGTWKSNGGIRCKSAIMKMNLN